MKRKIISLVLSSAMLFTTIFSMSGCGDTQASSVNINDQTPAAASSAEMNFTDVKPSDWFNESVSYAYENNLMNGVSETRFDPKGSLTRGMFVTILGRFANIDTDDYTGITFVDEALGQWYTPYVEWAFKNGITQGMGNAKFGVNDPVTREQMATFISRYLQSEGIQLPEADNPIAYFNDSYSVHDWAKSGVELMRKSGILAGDTNGNFRPLASASRAEAAAVFMRLDLAVNSSEEEDTEKTEADLYMEEHAKVISKTPVEDSQYVMTEVTVVNKSRSRGFTGDIMTEYEMDGEQLRPSKTVSSLSTDKHPSYYTSYVSASGELWTILINEDQFIAFPVTYNMKENRETITVLSEKKSIINHDVIDNVFYEIEPDGSQTIVKVVSSISAATLDSITAEEIDEL